MRLSEAYDARQRAGATVQGGTAAQGAAARASERERELSDAFSRLLAADVDIVLGTDAGAVPNHFFGYTGHRELEIFVRLGMTRCRIVAATSRPAARLAWGWARSLERPQTSDSRREPTRRHPKHTPSLESTSEAQGLRARWTGRN